MTLIKYLISGLVLVLFLAACASSDGKRVTLASLDSEFADQEQSKVTPEVPNGNPVPVLPNRPVLEIKHAYDQYLKHAPEDDAHRKFAIRRLADIELRISQEIARQRTTDDGDALPVSSDEDRQAMDKSQNLYHELLRKFPSSANNDEILYRLAHIEGKKGHTQQSMGYLEKLIVQFPKSRYFNEAQFRIAENAFSQGHYARAEDAYSAVIFSPHRSVFYQRSLFKRGWCRYKQYYYFEAVDDYFLAITALEAEREKDEFFDAQEDEYHKAIALAFARQGEINAIEDYFQQEQSDALLFKIYKQVSNLYLEQERYFDSAMLYSHYLKSHPNSPFHFDAYRQSISIWQKSGLKSKFIENIETFYLDYRPIEENMARRKRVAPVTLTPLLEKYGLAIASHYHELANESASSTSNIFIKNAGVAKQWYTRYIEDFSNSAAAVTAYYQYADLLVHLDQIESALSYYRKAAYENGYFKHKESAYALVSLIDEIPAPVDRTLDPWLQPQLEAAEKFCRFFPSDARANNVVVHVGKKAADGGKLAESVTLLETCRAAGLSLDDDFYILLAEGYFSLADYANAEKIYAHIRSAAKKEAISDHLALSIYRQGEAAQKEQSIELAISHFSRIVSLAPQSTISVTGLYQAISLAMAAGEYRQAIKMSQEFRALFPQNKFTPDVLKTLSIAYLNTEQHLRAADELAEVARLSGNEELKRAALFQAGELYKKEGKLQLAIENYREYAHSYPRPLDHYMEATYSLSSLYEKLGNQKNADFWRRKTVSMWRRFSKGLHSDRLQYIVAGEALALGHRSQEAFSRYRLVHPLQSNLKNKKGHMLDATGYFKVAASFPFSEIKPDAIYQIGTIYADFSEALLNSERPKSLSDIELEQYEILLEDQAFPFEDQAIEIHESNLRLASKGVTSKWIKLSFTKLESLYPARYKKQPKVDAVIYENP